MISPGRFFLAFVAFAREPRSPRPRKSPSLRRIDAYFGDWQGTATAMSETDEDFPTSKRDIAVSIAKTDLSGFLLSWSTLAASEGQPEGAARSLEVDDRRIRAPRRRPNQWRAKADADPYSGGILYWARLDGSGLVVSSFTINARTASPNIQTYRRRIVGKEMQLEFSNVKDGKFVRTVKGQLTRGKPR